jgi:hypothetical protein
MKLFGEKVIHTSTNSSLNILQIENYTEIFFDVFEIELNKKKYPVEKVSEYNGNPVVSIPVVVEGVKKDYPFVLTKGKRELLFNPKNTMEGLETAIASVPIIEEEVVDTDGPNVFEVLEKNAEILNQIKEAKRDAELSAKRLQQQKINEYSLKTKEREKLLTETLRDAKAHLVNEFLGISEKLKREILDTSSNQWEELQKTVNNRIEFLSDGLYDSVNEDFQNATAELDIAVRKLVQELHTSSVLPKLDKGLQDIATDIVEKVGAIESNLDKKLETKADISLIEEVAQGLDAIRVSNVELNNAVNKGVNKALSRVGNVKLQVDQIKEELTESVNDKIRDSVNILTDYFDNKVVEVEEKTASISEDERKYFLDLINNSRQSLLSEIQQIKTEAPVEYIIESKKGTPEKVDLGSLKAEYDKIISDKFANAVVDLRKYVAVYASGGGTNATQYQDGGIMYGPLTVPSLSSELVITGDLKTLNSGIVNRTSNNAVSSIDIIGKRSLFFTRNPSGYVTNMTDGVNTWTYSRDNNNNVIAWSVV